MADRVIITDCSQTKVPASACALAGSGILPGRLPAEKLLLVTFPSSYRLPRKLLKSLARC